MKTALLLFPARSPRPRSRLGGLGMAADGRRRNEWPRVRSHDPWNYLHARGRMRLMALMFYSSRRGYDERVSDLSDNDKH